FCVFLFSFFFFFSSRRRHTRFDCDWSSDVCSSDLSQALTFPWISRVRIPATGAYRNIWQQHWVDDCSSVVVPEVVLPKALAFSRSEERRVGKECRSRWWAEHCKRIEMKCVSGVVYD